LKRKIFYFERAALILAALTLVLFAMVVTGCDNPTSEDTALTGTVTVTGTAQVGETLTAVTTTLDGSGAISYWWQRSDSASGSFADITANANNATYTLVAADQGKYVRVTVSRTGYSGTVSSTATGQVAASTLPGLSGTVSITGTATVGETLTAVTTALGGSGAISYRWQWSDSTSSGFVDITGANAGTYVLVAADQGKYVRVIVSRAENSGTVSSPATEQVVAATLPGLTGTVSVTGTAQVGETLTAVTTALDGSGTVSYQWQRSDSANGDFADITDANNATYVLVTADQGKYVRVTVSRAGYSGTVSSTAPEQVVASTLPSLTGTVSVTGTAQVGETLTADTDLLEGSGAISYQWERGDTATGDFADIDAATNETYIPVIADLNKYLRVTVRRAENSGVVSSTATAQVAAPLPGTGSITIGFNYGVITITGSDGVNNIYKSTTSTPNSITLNASADYTDVKWYIDGDNTPVGTESSITLEASAYSAKAHSITFTGTRDDALYSQELPFTVKN
jgi:hypothetical protein